MTQPHKLLFLSLEDVIAAGGADIGQACTDIENGFKIYDKGEVVQPFKISLWKPDPASGGQLLDSAALNGFINIMPAIIAGQPSELYGCKLLGAMGSNADAGLPSVTGLVVLFDPKTKIPQAMMDAQVISTIRTGAVSGVAAKYLAPKTTESVGLIGAGLQMRAQLLAVLHALPSIKRVVVYSRGESKHHFAAEMSVRTGKEVIAVSNLEALVRENQFIITCVPMTAEPVFKAEWLASEGVTVFNIGGANTPLTALPAMDRLVADNWSDSKHRGTQSLPLAVREKLIDEACIEDLSTVITSKQGRRSPTENIFFCPVGMAFEDVMVAGRVYQTAIKRHIGQELNLWKNAQWL